MIQRAFPRPIFRPVALAGACILGVCILYGQATLAAGQPPVPVPAPASGEQNYRQLVEDGIRNNSLGRHQVAEKSFRTALARCGGTPGADCTDVNLRLALELSNQERFEEAELHFTRLEKTIRESKSTLSLPRYLTYRAMDAANRADFPTALKLISDANQKRKALLKIAFRNARSAEPAAKRRLDRTMIELAHGLYVQASVSLNLGKTAEAKVTAQLVRLLVAKIENIPDWWIAFADALLADIELRDGNIDAAEKRLRQALKAKQAALGNTRAVALSYMALGAIFNEARRENDAVDSSRPGLSILRGELRQAPGISIERLEPFLEASLKIAEKSPDRRAKLHAEMFAAAQLARTSQTARTVAQMAARFATGQPEIAELVRRLQSQTQLRDELRITLGRMLISASGATDAENVGKLKKSYARAARSVNALSGKIEKLFPSYSELVSPTPSSADTVAATLKSDEALVYFIFGDRSGYVFVARTDGVKAARIDIRRAELGGLIRRLRKPFEKTGDRIASYDLAGAHDMYLKLLGPVESALAGVRHLVVVSSGELLSLPFPLLVVRPPADGPDRYRTADWLIRGLAPLPDTAVEIRRVASALKAGKDDIHLGAAVTEQRLRAIPLDQYRVVYFATHGLLPGELRCQSQPALALSPADRATDDRTRDGLLEASEIAGLTLDADLVVLSACNTGGGGSGKLGGESLSGLARAFFQAGTRSVLVSHWQVDSIATTRLMTRTFGHIGKAASRHTARALQQAQLDLLGNSETAHPYFWAAFTLVGEGRDIKPTPVASRGQQIGQTDSRIIRETGQ